MIHYIALKASEDQLEKYSKILERAGIFRDRARQREAIYFSKDRGDTFISSGIHRTITVNTWKEFITEVLKHFTVSFPSEEEYKYIVKHFKTYNKDCHYFGYSDYHEKFEFWKSRPTQTAMPFKSFKILVDSMDTENKLTKKYNLELSGEELFYLQSLVGVMSCDRELGIIFESGKHNFINFMKSKKPELGRQVFSILNNVCPINDIDFRPKNPEFKFKNGLSATWIDETIIKIGCKQYSYDTLTSMIGSIFKYADKAEMEGYSFGKEEAEAFSRWIHDTKTAKMV